MRFQLRAMVVLLRRPSIILLILSMLYVTEFWGPSGEGLSYKEVSGSRFAQAAVLPVPMGQGQAQSRPNVRELNSEVMRLSHLAGGGGGSYVKWGNEQSVSMVAKSSSLDPQNQQAPPFPIVSSGTSYWHDQDYYSSIPKVPSERVERQGGGNMDTGSVDMSKVGNLMDFVSANVADEIKSKLKAWTKTTTGSNEGFGAGSKSKTTTTPTKTTTTTPTTTTTKTAPTTTTSPPSTKTITTLASALNPIMAKIEPKTITATSVPSPETSKSTPPTLTLIIKTATSPPKKETMSAAKRWTIIVICLIVTVVFSCILARYCTCSPRTQTDSHGLPLPVTTVLPSRPSGSNYNAYNNPRQFSK